MHGSATKRNRAQTQLSVVHVSMCTRTTTYVHLCIRCRVVSIKVYIYKLEHYIRVKRLSDKCESNTC